MEKSAFTKEGEKLQKLLEDMRVGAGLSQEALATRLHVRKSWVWKVIHGQRRIDLIEFFRYAEACGLDAAKAAADLLREFKRSATKSPR